MVAAGLEESLESNGREKPGTEGITKMQLTRRAALGAAAGSLLLAVSGTTAALAENTEVVTVSLWDKGPDSADMTDAMMKNTGQLIQNPLTATMGINIDKRVIPAGTVTFVAENDSKDIVHEMIVAPLKSGQTTMPYDDNEHAVKEDEAGHLGEVSELEPGAKGALTVTLKPGDYILYCNIPGHFAGGMWTILTVM